jgi:hypothetical protein
MSTNITNPIPIRNVIRQIRKDSYISIESIFVKTDEERERLGKLTFGDKARRGARHDADRLTLIGPGPKPLNGFRHGEQPSFPFSSVFANRLQKKGTRDVSTKKLRNDSG